MKKRTKKKKINSNRIIAIILLIVIAFIIFKLVKNKSKEKEVAINDATNIAESENLEVENNVENNEKEEVLDKRSNKQKELLEERISNNKFLSESGLPVLMYHFFYDKTKESGKDGNWIDISDFEEQMKYLSENNFYFPTWQEVEDYIDGSGKLPEKSVVITIDDGDPSFFEFAVPIIQRYDVYATSFVVTYWYGNRAEDKQANISYQSHSYDMHKGGANGKGVMLSWDYDKMKKDVELSSEVLGGANIFCYPFGQYNEQCFKVLKDAGYKLAFTTEGGRVKVGDSKYKLPRVRISGNTSISAFAKKVE